MPHPREISPDTASELLASLTRLIRSAKSAGRQVQEGRNVADTSTVILKALAHAEAAGTGDRPGDLAETVGVAPSVVSRAVAKLEEEGLVSRERDEADARSCHLRLTDQGRAELAAAQLAYSQRLAEMLADSMSDRQAHALARGIDVLTDAVGRAHQVQQAHQTTQTPALTVAGSSEKN